jgi:hypothetical protein
MTALQWVVDGILAFGAITIGAVAYESESSRMMRRRGLSCASLVMYLVMITLIVPIPLYILIAQPSTPHDRLIILGFHMPVGLALILLVWPIVTRLTRLSHRRRSRSRG